jgi:L-amino acid N-acyltransferase YncA
MEYIIRHANETDLPAIVDLCEKHAAYERAAYDATGKQDRLRHAIFSEPKKLFCFVVEAGEALAGYYTYTFDYSTWEANHFLYLDCLYLEPAFRGKRIGESIFKKLTDDARKKGCTKIKWQTPEFNERAIKFYHRIGAQGTSKMRFNLAV